MSALVRIKKIRHVSWKFFGYPEDNWARLGGKNGKKRSYGHFSGYSNAGGRSVAEIRNADDRRINEQENGSE
jgi:hypothetical protein